MAQADDLKERLAQVAHGGWDGLEDGEAVIAEAARRQEIEQAEREANHRAMVRAAFVTPQGQALLEWLKANTILLPPQADELMATTAEAYALAAKKREGQNSIVFKILSLLAEPDKPQTEPL